MSAKKTTDRIKVECHCGASLMAPKKAIGKRVKCPRCSKPFTVPDPGSTVDRMIYALRDDEYNKPALEEQPGPPEAVPTEHGKLCPNCQQEIKKEAVFCVKCGYHLEKGMSVGAGGGQRKGLAGLLNTFKQWLVKKR